MNLNEVPVLEWVWSTLTLLIAVVLSAYSVAPPAVVTVLCVALISPGSCGGKNVVARFSAMMFGDMP